MRYYHKVLLPYRLNTSLSLLQSLDNCTLHQTRTPTQYNTILVPLVPLPTIILWAQNALSSHDQFQGNLISYRIVWDTPFGMIAS